VSADREDLIVLELALPCPGFNLDVCPTLWINHSIYCDGIGNGSAVSGRPGHDIGRIGIVICQGCPAVPEERIAGSVLERLFYERVAVGEGLEQI